MRTDWVSPWWQAALLPELWDVCGYRVPSLTVWHVYALRNVGNGYVRGSVGCDRDDAASLLLFASRDYRGGRALMLKPMERKAAILKAVKRLKRIEWKELDAACADYVTTCMRTADRFGSGEHGKPNGVPEAWHLVRLLSNSDPTKLDAAWNTPYAVACALMDSNCEANGDKTIMYDRAQEMHDNWDQYVEKYGWDK